MLEIRITAPELSEAINNLANALACGCSGHGVCNQHGENNTHIDNVGTVNVDIPVSVETAPVAPTAPVANPITPATAPQTVPTAQSTPPVSSPTPAAPTIPTAAPQYTLEMIAKAGTALVDAGKLDEVAALLAKFGVDVLTSLNPAMYGAFATELRALGAQI